MVPVGMGAATFTKDAASLDGLLTAMSYLSFRPGSFVCFRLMVSCGGGS